MVIKSLQQHKMVTLKHLNKDIPTIKQKTLTVINYPHKIYTPTPQIYIYALNIYGTIIIQLFADIFNSNMQRNSDIFFVKNIQLFTDIQGENKMLKWKINVIEELKKAGYTTYTFRKNSLFSNSTVQKIKSNQPISWDNINRICKLLKCQPGDILEYIEDENEDEKKALYYKA